jgi:hypothetical protein
MAQYNQGTVSVVKGSDIIIGRNTNWALPTITVGNYIKIKDEPVLYTIGAVVGLETLTLSYTYKGTTKSDYEYQIITDYTDTLNLFEFTKLDKDYFTFLNLGFIWRMEELFGIYSTTQFLGIKCGDEINYKEQKLTTTILNPMSGIWYSSGTTITVDEGFSSLVKVLYEDDSNHSNDRTCLAFLGGCYTVSSTWELDNEELCLETTPETLGLWEIDVNGDVMPAISGSYDSYWEYDGSGDVMPIGTDWEVGSPVYLARPNGTDIEVRLSANQIQVMENVSNGSKLSITTKYLTHKV